jgi:hypothetical protein
VNHNPTNTPTNGPSLARAAYIGGLGVSAEPKHVKWLGWLLAVGVALAVASVVMARCADETHRVAAEVQRGAI